MFHEYAGTKPCFIEMDISKKSEVEGDFSHIFHAANPTTAVTRTGKFSNLYESSFLGARNLIEMAKRQGNTPVFVPSSAGAVYDRQPISLARLPLTRLRQATPSAL